VIAICGDGGFMMNSQELETAVRLGLHVVVLILRDNAYGMIKWKQASMGLTPFGLDYGNPDFVRYAESYGAMGHRVTRADGLRSTLQLATDEPGVHVIEIPVDYSDNNRILDREIPERSARV
jgi:acetolactate synthase-1/2/3 large subunit